MSNYVVIDIGGTAVKYAFMDEESGILAKGSVPSPARTAAREEFLALIDEIQKPWENQYAGIAVSAPGIIDSRKGIIHVIGAFPCLRECALKDILQERYRVPAAVENDGKCAALAELWKGALAGKKDGAVFLIGTAIGGGIVLDGKLRRGDHFFAGEFSGACTDIYHPADEKNYLSELGTRCLIRKIAERYGEDPAGLDGKAVFDRINAGEEKACEALKEYTDLVAMAVFNINILLDLELFCIGGGISEQPELIRSLKQSIQDIPLVHPDILAGTKLPLPEVTACEMRADANLSGALYHLLHESA